MLIPLYGFLQGDTIGILVLAHDTDSVDELARRLRQASAVRVEPREGSRVRYLGKVLAPHLTLTQAGFQALDRFDVEDSNEGAGNDDF
jgi:hypothetical protein